MLEKTIKNQWRVLFLEHKLPREMLLEALSFGYNGAVVDAVDESLPLKQILRIEPPCKSPFDPLWREYLTALPLGQALYYPSKLLSFDCREELLKRALLPHELFLEELKLFEGRELFCMLPTLHKTLPPFKERHYHELVRKAPKTTYFLYPHVNGPLGRYDLPAHPLAELRPERTLPLFASLPLGVDSPYVVATDPLESFAVQVNAAWDKGSMLEAELKRFLGTHSGTFLPLDSRLCYLNGVANGQENPQREELRLLTEALIAEMRWEEKRGELRGHAFKKALIVKALEASKLPIPYHLKLAEHA